MGVWAWGGHHFMTMWVTVGSHLWGLKTWTPPLSLTLGRWSRLVSVPVWARGPTWQPGITGLCKPCSTGAWQPWDSAATHMSDVASARGTLGVSETSLCLGAGQGGVPMCV